MHTNVLIVSRNRWLLLVLLLASFGYGQANSDSLNLGQLLASYGMGGYQITLDRDGNNKPDTVVSRFAKSYWGSIASGSTNAVGLYGTPFDIRSSAVNGVGLFTQANKTFQPGDVILIIFMKRNNAGKFNLDYIETPPATFVNDSEHAPNTRIELCPEGLRIVATTVIAGGTEILSNYRELIALFPGDTSVESTIRYW